MAEPVIASWSEIDTFRQCPHKHLRSYIERWTRPTKSAALAKGTAWHSVMEAHYNAIQTIRTNQPDTGGIYKAFDDITDPEMRELIEWMYAGYKQLYGFDREWEIVSVEGTTVIPLPAPNRRSPQYHLKMKLDLVIRWKGRIYVVDHKSGKDLPSGKRLDFDDQFGLYTWGMRQLGLDVFGSMHNAARTFRPKDPTKEMALDSRFRRTPLYRTDAELATIAREAYQTVRRAYRDSDGERNPNPDTCQWRCDFTEACLHGRKTTDAQEVDYLESSGFVQDFRRH